MYAGRRVYTCLTLVTVTYISLCYCVTDCGGAQTCTECMERNAQTNFSCEWCTKTEKLVHCNSFLYIATYATHVFFVNLRQLQIGKCSLPTGKFLW